MKTTYIIHIGRDKDLLHTIIRKAMDTLHCINPATIAGDGACDNAKWVAASGPNGAVFSFTEHHRVLEFIAAEKHTFLYISIEDFLNLREPEEHELEVGLFIRTNYGQEVIRINNKQALEDLGFTLTYEQVEVKTMEICKRLGLMSY